MAVRVSWLEKALKPDSDPIAASFGWLEKFLAPEEDRAERRRVDQFAAYRWNGSALTQEAVRDISSTGLYLVTKERWEPGTILTLNLQREGSLELDPARRITTQAKVARCGTDGVGLTFLWSKDDPESRRWETLLESLIEQTKPRDMQSLVQMVEAFAFLGRICSEGAEEIGEWVRTRASSHKVLNAVSIALKTENVLGLDLAGTRARVNPQVAVRILEIGSGTDEEWLHGFWAGLLITSISPDGRDTTNLEFVELFSQLTSIPIRIFTVVCTRATKVLSESGKVIAKPLACNMEELVATVGSRGSLIERDLEALSGFQLIEIRAGSASALLRSNEVYITPTTLGLQLFALCNGHRGTPREFYF
ncbi:MAG: PilZ domain-containing protein [Terracidiphilus sp.]